MSHWNERPVWLLATSAQGPKPSWGATGRALAWALLFAACARYRRVPSGDACCLNVAIARKALH